MSVGVMTTLVTVGRWEPDARGRLTRAAIELYAESGYEHTTVADIAARAGVTERTFFRHFVDKREVLFDGAAELQQHIVRAVIAAPPEVDALDAVVAAIADASALLAGRRVSARQRAAIIASDTSLQERDLLKLARLSAAVAEALRRRGVLVPAATLVADTGLTVFRVAFDLWLAGQAEDLGRCVHETLDDLRGVVAAPLDPARRTARR